MLASELMAVDKKPVSELHRERLQRIEAELKVIELQAKQLNDERMATLTAICQSAGISNDKLMECNLDRQTWTVWQEAAK